MLTLYFCTTVPVHTAATYLADYAVSTLPIDTTEQIKRSTWLASVKRAGELHNIVPLSCAESHS